MHLFISHTNLWILAVGFAIAAVNVFASSRLAPLVAGLFARSGHALPPPSRRGV